MKTKLLSILLISYSFTMALSIEPVIKLDFEKMQSDTLIFGDGQGINGSTSLVMNEPNSKPYVIEDKQILEQLAGIKSLTITGWIKRPASTIFNDIGYVPPAVVSCGNFQVFFEQWGRLGIIMTGEDGRRKQLWGGWINIQNFSPDNRWVFFAFSYDGTKPGVNCALYYGYQEYSIEREVFATADAGQRQDDPDAMWGGGEDGEAAAGMLTTNVPGALVIGASNANGARQFDGQIDSVRIYASTDDGSAALKPWEIEQIRLSDIGADSFKQAAVEKAITKTQENKRIWEIEEKYWLDTLNLHRIETFSRVFSCEPPEPLLNAEPVSVPRGSKTPFKFAVMSRQRAKVEAEVALSDIIFEDGSKIDLPFTLYHVKHIPVEANTNGGINTTISSRPPQIWMEHLIKEAPFEVAEVLVPTNGFLLRENNMHAIRYKAVLVDIEVPLDAKPGLYHSKIVLNTTDGKAESDFSFRVHKTAVDQEPKLDNVYWFKADPVNLTTGDVPVLWSDEHWQLIENSARTLRAFGQTSVSASLIWYRDETVNMIDTIKKADGSFEFDFKIFDRWVETFLKCGFTGIEGECTFGGHRASAQNVKAFDEQSGQFIELFTTKSPLEDWFDFMEIFYTHLYEHLKQRGWDKYYVQTILDEPLEAELGNYKRAYELTKKCMPNIPVKDACGNAVFSDYMDLQVFNTMLARDSYQKLAEKRRAEGKGVWYYHCASPYPPYPNRHLDEPLANSRLFPWLAFSLNADGYLWRAAKN